MAQIALQYGAMRSGKKAAKKAGKRAARAILAEAAIERQQQALAGQREVSLGKAMIGASGLQEIGSSAGHIQAMESQNIKRLDWITESAKRRARAAKKGGQAEARAIKWQGWTQIASSITSGASAGG